MVLVKRSCYGNKPVLYALLAVFLCSRLCAEEPVDKGISVESLQASYSFTRFMNLFGSKLRKFQQANVPSVSNVFYPFGGPDLIHPMLLFPDAKTYVLVGLEYPGKKLTAETRDETFVKIDSLLKRGFFVTANMGKTFNHRSGVWAALTLEIMIMGGKIIDEELLDPKSVRIKFEWEGKERTVYYFRRNLVDNADGLFEVLSSLGVSDVCLMKSSSYSPHRDMFANLKGKILNTFSMLVQDDTGMPVRELGNFNVQVFGRYVKPYGVEWRGYEQPELKKLYDAREDVPHVNFCFGYGCGKVEANISIAKRKAGVAE